MKFKSDYGILVIDFWFISKKFEEKSVEDEFSVNKTATPLAIH